MTDCNLRDVNDVSSWYMTDSDNDGLWTSFYLGASVLNMPQRRIPKPSECEEAFRFHASAGKNYRHFRLYRT